jgi:hypothetical protein
MRCCMKRIGRVKVERPGCGNRTRTKYGFGPLRSHFAHQPPPLAADYSQWSFTADAFSAASPRRRGSPECHQDVPTGSQDKP